MASKLKSLSMAAVVALSLTAMSGAMAGDRVLSADEVKKLVTGNTVDVTRVKDGKQWKIFFAPDGKGFESKDKVRGTWEVKGNGEHCVSWSPNFACARVADIGGGKYARLKSDGSHIVIWTVEAGNKL